MKKITLEELPYAVREKIITKKEAAKIIWEEIYTNPNQYGLFLFSEDQKSDLLLEMHGQFEKIFEKYIPGTVSFKTFITGCLTNYKSAFLRKQLSKENERHTIDTYLLSQSEAESQKYDVNISAGDKNKEKKNLKTLADITKKIKGNSREKNKRIADLILIVLMMKACKDIDDETIKSVSEFTGIDKSELHEMILELKESMSKQEKNNRKIEIRRNNAYFFHRKYMQEMCTSNSNSIKVEELKRKYELQTKKWKDQNKKLSLRSKSPSNEEIARIIGIKTRTVCFYINHAKRKKIQDSIKQFYRKNEEKPEEEDLSFLGEKK